MDTDTRATASRTIEAATVIRSPARPATAATAASPTTTAVPVSCPSGVVAISSGGLSRRYVVTRPAATTTSPPILLLFHGYTGSPESVTEASRLPAAAAEQGWVVVAPQGSGLPSRWALQTLNGPNDVAFVRDVIADVSADGCADASRVAAVGYSNGAGFAAVLTCELDLVASAMVAGANLGPTCARPDGYPMVVAHGEADEVVPLAGGPVIGGALQARPLLTVVEAWRASGASVTTVLVPEWGHAWTPGATDAVLAAFATVAA